MAHRLIWTRLFFSVAIGLAAALGGGCIPKMRVERTEGIESYLQHQASAEAIALAIRQSHEAGSPEYERTRVLYDRAMYQARSFLTSVENDALYSAIVDVPIIRYTSNRTFAAINEMMVTCVPWAPAEKLRDPLPSLSMTRRLVRQLQRAVKNMKNQRQDVAAPILQEQLDRMQMIRFEELNSGAIRRKYLGEQGP